MKTSTIVLSVFIALLVVGIILRLPSVNHNYTYADIGNPLEISGQIINVLSPVAIGTIIIYKIRFRKSDDESLKKKIILICGGIILGFGAELLVIVSLQAVAGAFPSPPSNPHLCFEPCYNPIGGALMYLASGIPLFLIGLFLVLSSSKR